MTEEKKAFELERNRGWEHGMPTDHEALPICGLCSEITLEGQQAIVVLHRSKKKNDTDRVWKMQLCDDHRRMLCTCDNCAAFEVQEDDPDLDETPDGEEPDEEAFSMYCLRSHEDKETLPEKWCLEWTQARLMEASEIEERINELEEEEEEEEEEGDDNEG